MYASSSIAWMNDGEEEKVTEFDAYFFRVTFDFLGEQ